MAKVKKGIHSVLLNISRQSLTSRELRVFLAWFTDAEHYQASQRTLAKRTGIPQPDVCKILDSLVSKKVLVIRGINSYGVTHYVLPDSLLKEPEAEAITPNSSGTIEEMVAQPSSEMVTEPSIPFSTHKEELLTSNEENNSFEEGEGELLDSKQSTLVKSDKLYADNKYPKREKIMTWKDEISSHLNSWINNIPDKYFLNMFLINRVQHRRLDKDGNQTAHDFYYTAFILGFFHNSPFNANNVHQMCSENANQRKFRAKLLDFTLKEFIGFKQSLESDQHVRATEKVRRLTSLVAYGLPVPEEVLLIIIDSQFPTWQSNDRIKPMVHDMIEAYREISANAMKEFTRLAESTFSLTEKVVHDLSDLPTEAAIMDAVMRRLATNEPVIAPAPEPKKQESENEMVARLIQEGKGAQYIQFQLDGERRRRDQQQNAELKRMADMGIDVFDPPPEPDEVADFSDLYKFLEDRKKSSA